jgi:predicted ATPase
MAAPAALLLDAVPIPRTRLIGRETERETARRLLLNETVPLLTLTGPGGVGKTRLALAITTDVVTSFADGVVWVDLAPLADAALVPATVATILGITTRGARSVVAALMAQLRAEQRLLVLDNCEHVLASAAELVAELLASCPVLQFLTTSRAPLHIRDEQVLPVPTLTVPAPEIVDLDGIRAASAVALFVQRAGRRSPVCPHQDERRCRH